ncbi:MAG: hypothetical protein KJP10_00005 [Gammaproteobacteria bacterium]|nr:hypothetical protein [Gammaproteobacteria bacterium]
MNQKVIISTVIGLAFTSQFVTAGSITDTYTTGDTLTATTLDNIKTAVNDNDTQISALKSGFVSVSAVAGSHNEYNGETNRACGSFGCTRNTSVTPSPILLTTPVQLPHGASITSFTYRVYDDHPTANGTASLSRDIDGFAEIASASSSGSAGLETVSVGLAPGTIVDNSEAGYYVLMSTWNDTPTGVVYGVNVTIGYTLP